jgi:hypothetical protein
MGDHLEILLEMKLEKLRLEDLVVLALTWIKCGADVPLILPGVLPSGRAILKRVLSDSLA